MALLELLESYGVLCKRPWGQVTVSCPFDSHPDDQPSFRANLDRDVWICQGCGRKGNLVTLIAQKEGITNEAARQRATEILGNSFVDIPPTDGGGGSYLPEWARSHYGLGRNLSDRPGRGTSPRSRNDAWKNMYSLH